MKVELVLDLLNKIQGCTFAGLDCVTNVKLTGGKSNPMQGRVTKECFGNRVILFTNKNSSGYENMVKRRLEKEGKDPSCFELGELAWGNRIPNSPLVEHNGKYYLQTVFQKAGKPKYYLDGKPIKKEKIIGFPKEREGSGRQGLDDDNKVVVRTYALESIKCIRAFKEERCENGREVVEFQVCEGDDYEQSSRSEASDNREEQVQP